MTSLSHYLKSRKLVSIKRAGVGGYGIQGFLAGASDDLLAIEYVYDFQVDGLMILRQSDITEINRTKTDEFQESLLRHEGILAGHQAPSNLNLDTWQSVILQLSKNYPLMTFERELGPSPEFSIGRPLKITGAQVEVQTFTGTGRWSSKPRRIKYAQLSCVQVNNRYTNFYQRYFDRGAA